MKIYLPARLKPVLCSGSIEYNICVLDFYSGTIKTRGERGDLVVESLTLGREVGDSIPTSAVKDTFTPRKVLVIPRKRWLRPDMTEKLLTGTLSININKQTIKNRGPMVL